MNEINDRVTREKIVYYLQLTNQARSKATPLVQAGSKEDLHLQILLKMSDDYASDAKYFMEKGDFVRALAAINYAHAWIDAGVKLGFLDGHGDDDLFTLP